MAKRKIPERLYKYRAFSNRTLDSLIADQLFFADPGTFNDPLDSKPSLATDLDADALADILARLVEQRVSAEMTAAAKTIKYRGPKTLSHIAAHSRRRAEQMIAEIRYNATNPDYEIDDPARFLFGQYVEEELLRRYDKGIVSLAGRSDCPLMWSHYGDQHKGVCIGYSVPQSAASDLHKITYGGSRLIEASTVAAMLDGDDNARRKVDEAVLTRKAMDWRYEREWRLIGPRGPHDSPLELEEVVFGMRCSHTVKFAIVRALERRHRQVKFYEIRERRGRFLLGRYVLDADELSVSLPRRALDIEDFFEPIVDEE
ncbi:DUF2971 domain-containing protein [Brucella anthropi]|uniref:DUF2971 domain-containing protein n=1 Tax=Brucella anthropi TaxID=529 RepID=UPI000DEC4064|nr:DUF2971 domain-containing protein [Brucella anthropi]RCI80652.1 DUF2971 domain-containing protein [Brucella anthropi]